MSALEQKGFQTPTRWALLKGVSAALIYLLLCFAVLCLVYPIGQRIRSFRYPLSQALTEYLLLSSLVMCIVVLVVPLLTWWCNRLVIWMNVMIRTVSTFVILFFLAAYVGTSDHLGDYWPASQIESFFSELEFLIFEIKYAPIVSVLAAIYYTWTGRNRAVPPSSHHRYATRGRSRER